MTLVYDGRGSGFVLANPERKIGNRVSKTVAGVTTTYLVDTLNPTGYAQVVYETFSGSSAPNRELNHVYVYGLELLGQTRNYVANSQSNTQQIYYDYDGHGSVRALSDPNGNVTDTYDYDAFGNLIHSTGSTPNLYLFAGEQFDPDLNLYYNRARYLNTSTGRFWTMDSSEGDAESPFSLHKYLYASADPIDRIDPSGHEDLASLSIGSAIGNTLNNLTAIQGQGIINQIEYGGSSGLATLLLGSFTPIALEGATALASSFAAKLLQSPITRDLLDRALPIIQKLCFAQGTLIVTRRGNTPIEQIKVGDEVLSKNLKTGALEYKKVSRLLPSGHSRVLVISLKDEISIEVTSGHLLFAKRQSNSGGWAMAGQLKVGDSLFDKEGQFILIEKIEQRRDEVSVFNFEVDGNHDYFVSERGILAHNGCEALRAIAESAASKFGILECVPCAEAIKDAFQANGIVGKVIELTPKSEDAELIVSDFVPAQAISTNGRHVAVEVDGIIFDNITPNGIARADWEASLSTRAGGFNESFYVAEKPF